MKKYNTFYQLSTKQTLAYTPHTYTRPTHKGLPKPIKEDSSKYYWIYLLQTMYAVQYIIVDSAIAISCLLSTVISCATTDTMLHT